MPSTKEIRRRIKSIKSTRQITKAMELVSAAKMRKAQMQTLATRAYAKYAWQLVQNLTVKADPRIHALLRPPKQNGRALMVVMSSNRGLIGAFNNHITEAANAYARKFVGVDVITLGKKSRDSLKKLDFQIVADFEKKDTTNSVMDINILSQMVISEFVSGKYDRVALVYMDFISTLQQKPHVLELLPLKQLDPSLGMMSAEGDDEFTPSFEDFDYTFEPSAQFVLEEVLPRLTIMQVYQALLETNAAEHSARMVAMKNASDAAGDLLTDLTLEYNKLRQANITKEISEIVAGKLALTN